MAFFGGQSKSPASLEPQTETVQQQTEDLPDLPPDSHSNTVIAKDVLVTGKVSGEGVVQIDGTVEGEVILKGYVSITATGKVKGPVEADVIRIAGRVEGSVLSHDHVQLERTGTIEGDVTTVSFVIENGGCLNGRTTMVQAKKPLPKPDKSSTPKPESSEKTEKKENAN
ncbi:MAG: polymer-forming cytoskeletal protein [Oscillibacter sp.]|nr:polymer-forming cytoskeletal protein [Oscillibacter sp.]